MKGVLFRAEMVQAIAAGRKTVTRRVIKGCVAAWGDGTIRAESPRYHPGEIVYIKEAWYVGKQHDHLKPRELPRDMPVGFIVPLEGIGELPGRLRSPLFLPERMARFFLKIKSVMTCRTRDITSQDCMAEGIRITRLPLCGPGGATVYHWEDYPTPKVFESARTAYFALYDSINGRGAHDKNWDFRYEFEIRKP